MEKKNVCVSEIYTSNNINKNNKKINISNNNELQTSELTK